VHLEESGRADLECPVGERVGALRAGAEGLSSTLDWPSFYKV
jgi:hypothetical protein